jgi:glycosyltransferase involved in cell wall biosynthesis
VKRPRVLHICSDTNIGGAGRYVLALLTQPLVTERFEVAVACPEGELAVALRQAGVQVLLYPGADTSFSWASLTVLVKLMRAWRPAVVHTHGSLAGRVAGALVGARIVYTKHGLASTAEQAIQVRTPGALLKRLAVRAFVHRTVAVSAAVKRSLVAAGADPDRVVIIPGGIDLEAYAGACAVTSAPTDTIGTMARLSHEKGIDVLLRAVADLPASTQVLIGGDGPQLGPLAAQIAELGLANRVTLAGFVSDVPQFMTQLNLFVLPSRSEGLGLVLIEAMAAGLPVVATQVGGIPEVVVHGETGLLVPPEDAGALAAAIRQVLADPALAARMGEAGRIRAAACFSAERMAEQTVALYRELLPH